MTKRKLYFVLIVCLLGCFVSTAFAATTFKRVNVNPFYRPPLTSETDLKALVKSRNSHIRTGFAKAGYPKLYRAFSEQFPSATIESIKVSPGETFKWMFFRKKGTGPVIVTKDVTWGGAGPLDAYRFYIDVKDKRYEFAVLQACGNFALKNITNIPSATTPSASGKAATVSQAAKPSTLGKTMTDPAAPFPITSGEAAAAAPAPMPGVPESATASPSAPMSGVPESAVTGPAAPIPGASERAAAVSPAPMPDAAGKAATGSMASMSTAKFPGGLVADTGFSYQFDPASYLFARIGYEFPLFDKLSLLAFVGGSFRIHGKDGGSSFIADAILDYHWWNRLSFGLGAGFWSGNDGQIDLIANLGFLVFGNPNSFNGTLFLEARSEIGELNRLHDEGRFGLGMRFRF